MKFYNTDFPVGTELIESFKFIKNYQSINDINNSDIIIFHNFTMNNYILYIKHNKIFNNKKLFCYVHEPLIFLKESYINKIVKRLKICDKITIITYSLYNKKLCENIFNRKVYYLPLNYYHYSDLKFNKKLNICINHRGLNPTQTSNSAYNNSIININDIQNNKNIIVLNHWGHERDELYKNIKIFVNLHRHAKTQLFETLRLHNLIYNRVIIISQKCIDSTELLYKYVIFVNNNKLLEKANEILNNYDEYYNKTYGKLTNKQIFQDIQKYYDEFEKSLLIHF